MKRDVYKILAEKYDAIEQITDILEQADVTRYEWQREGLEVGNQQFDVYCNFERKREAIDYQFDPRQDRGRDIYAMIPARVLDVKGFVTSPTGEGPEVTDPELLKKIASVALETAREEATRDTEEVQYGEYM
jgi:hypothetical protein